MHFIRGCELLPARAATVEMGIDLAAGFADSLRIAD
jgi:hypothetical protein